MAVGGGFTEKTASRKGKGLRAGIDVRMSTIYKPIKLSIKGEKEQ